MRKFLALSSVVGSVTAPAMLMVIPNVTVILTVLILGLAAPIFSLTSTSLAGLVVTFAFSFFSAGGITPSELLIGL